MTLRAILMGLAFALMWSSAFATARIIVAHGPPLFSLSLRFLISGAIAILVAKALGQSWHLPGGWRGVQARSVLVFGLCQNALYLGLNFVAMQKIEGSLAAIVASSMPLMVAALGWLWRGERIAPLGMVGLVTGMVGVTVIMGSRLQGGADAFSIGLCIAGSVALAIATLSMRGATGSGNLLMVVGLQMLVGAVSLGLLSALTETIVVTPAPAYLAAMAYQILVPGLAATLLWFSLVRDIGAVRAATFHFLNPAFGVAVAALLLGETISGTDLIGVVIAMAGIFAVQIARARV